MIPYIKALLAIFGMHVDKGIVRSCWKRLLPFGLSAVTAVSNFCAGAHHCKGRVGGDVGRPGASDVAVLQVEVIIVHQLVDAGAVACRVVLERHLHHAQGAPISHRWIQATHLHIS